jgi:hypothetical protein
MDVIDHKAICADPASAFYRIFPEQVEIQMPVAVVKEDPLFIIPALYYMMWIF